VRRGMALSPPLLRRCGGAPSRHGWRHVCLHCPFPSFPVAPPDLWPPPPSGAIGSAPTSAGWTAGTSSSAPERIPAPPPPLCGAAPAVDVRNLPEGIRHRLPSAQTAAVDVHSLPGGIRRWLPSTRAAVDVHSLPGGIRRVRTDFVLFLENVFTECWLWNSGNPQSVCRVPDEGHSSKPPSPNLCTPSG
jgi:hypothetical protein